MARSNRLGNTSRRQCGTGILRQINHEETRIATKSIGKSREDDHAQTVAAQSEMRQSHVESERLAHNCEDFRVLPRADGRLIVSAGASKALLMMRKNEK